MNGSLSSSVKKNRFMPLVKIYPVPSSLPQPSLGCSRLSAHPAPRRIRWTWSNTGQALLWIGAGVETPLQESTGPTHCPQAQIETPRLKLHTTEPAAKAKLCPSHPTLLHLLPSTAAYFFSVPPSTPLFQRHFPPRCQMDAEERGDSDTRL